MRVVAGARQDLLDLAHRVADDVRFRRLEVDRAPLLAGLQQRAEHVVQVQQVRHDARTAARFRTVRVAEDRGHFVVREARGRVHHGRIELVCRHFACACDDHVAHERQAVDGRVQRAQAVRQFFRQHRDDAAREVHGRRTLDRVAVERVVRLDVMADVGDCHEQAVALRAADPDGLAVHGVVEVARILAVDRDERDVAQVDALAQVALAHFVRQLARLLDGGGREDVRHAELAHGDLDLHARIVQFAQHFDDAAGRLLEARRLFDQFDADDLAGLGLARRAGHEDVLADALVFRRDDPDAVLVQQAPDDVRVGAFRDFDDRAFGAAAAVGADDTREHAVAVQDLLHFLIGQEQVFAAFVGNDEAEAVAVRADAAGNETGVVRERVVARRVGAQLAVALHRIQAARQHAFRFRVDLQGSGEGRAVERTLGLAEHAEDFLAAWNGIGWVLQIRILIFSVGGAAHLHGGADIVTLTRWQA